jgi:hypothetical protein
MIEEDEMSEEEINKQLQQNEFYQFKKAMKNTNPKELERYNSRLAKEKQ